VADVARDKFGTDEFEHFHELGEHEDAVAFGDEGFEGVEEGFEFGAVGGGRSRSRVAHAPRYGFTAAFFGGGGVGSLVLAATRRVGGVEADEARVAANLAEAEEGLEDVEALRVELAGVFDLEEELAGAVVVRG